MVTCFGEKKNVFLSFFQAIAIEIKHDDKLPEDSQAYFQCALLYTSISGQRRLRIHNLAFSTCSQLSDLFRCCEMDTFVNVVSKQGETDISASGSLSVLSHWLYNYVVV